MENIKIFTKKIKIFIETIIENIVKGGPEPLEKEIHEMLGSKREDRLSDPFFELVQKTCQVRFQTCFGTLIYVRARGHCKSSRRR